MNDFEDRISRGLHHSADAVEPPPLLWRRVEDRIGRPRDRRAIAVLAVAAATVIAVAMLAVALHKDASPKHVASVAPSTTDAGGVVVPASQETTTAPTTVTTAPTSSPSTTRPTTTTVVPGSTTTTTTNPRSGGGPCDGAPASPGTYRAYGEFNVDVMGDGAGQSVSAPFELQ